MSKENTTNEYLKSLQFSLPNYWGAECRYRYAKALALMSRNLKKQMIKYFKKHKTDIGVDWDKVEIEIKPEVIAKIED